MMSKFGDFLKRKDIEISLKRYGIDALGAMAQGLFCSLLVGTILNTIGTQFNIGFLTKAVATVGETSYTVGGIAMAMCGPAMAVAIGYALKCPPLVLFSMISVGFAANTLGATIRPASITATIFFIKFPLYEILFLRLSRQKTLFVIDGLILSYQGGTCSPIFLNFLLFCVTCRSNERICVEFSRFFCAKKSQDSC